MKPEIQHILDTIKQEYSHLDTIIVFGSALTSDWTPKSDIDIFLIDDSLHDSRSEETIKDIAVELQKDNFKNLTKDIEAERGNLLHRNVSTMIADSQTLSAKSPDKLNALINLAKDVLSSDPSYTDEDIKMWRYSITDYLSKAEKDVARNDALAFYLDANYVLQNALELSLATHRTYLPQPKHLAKLLQDKDPELSKIWQTYLSAPDLESKLQALSQLSVR